ncbi:glycosyltransferase family 5 protein [Atractiella rhizophila]|nr:glycosyltransferase family 5 protein [Atractiella rhizophila]
MFSKWFSVNQPKPRPSGVKRGHQPTESTIGLESVLDGDDRPTHGRNLSRSTSVSLSPAVGAGILSSRPQPRRRPTYSEDHGYGSPRPPTFTSSRGWLQSPTRLTPRKIVVAVFVFFTFVLLYKRWSDDKFNQAPLPKPTIYNSIESYEAVRYQHLNTSESIILPQKTRIFHVTKEFGPASMGGLGTVVTALVKAQAENPLLDVSVIMPYYSFLRSGKKIRTRGFAELAVEYRQSAQSRTSTVSCHVSVGHWDYWTQDHLDPDLPIEDKEKRSITIYFVGPGDVQPFRNAFKAENKNDIYSAYKPLPAEWKDLYFAKSVSELVAFINSESDDATIFGHDDDDDDTSAVIDVLHVHGATNAMVMHYIKNFRNQHMLGENPPSIVYTLHDYLDEVEYSNRVSNVESFLDTASPTSSALDYESLQPYVHEQQVFTSALGIDLADQVTFVSRSVARDLVQLEMDFYLKELVLPSLLSAAKAGNFFGISNGIDLEDGAKNPFTGSRLIEAELAFPRVGEDVTSFSTFWTQDETGGKTKVSFYETKVRAKKHLIESLPDVFNEDDLQRPFLLFIGRFQYNKGCDFFDTIARKFNGRIRLIVMGQHNNYPSDRLKILAKQFPDRFTLIDDAAFQAQWGSILRMASDFAFVPSFSESFGIVAAEGLLFGMPVISSGVGGLAEFLTPIKDDKKIGNAYLFDALGQDPVKEGLPLAKDPELFMEPAGRNKAALARARTRLLSTLDVAIAEWERTMLLPDASWVDKETFVRRLVSNALGMSWDRDGGPVDEYNLVYQRALDLVDR